jgi:hypothetical protein
MLQARFRQSNVACVPQITAMQSLCVSGLDACTQRILLAKRLRRLVLLGQL